jgi:hypothetical protein
MHVPVTFDADEEGDVKVELNEKNTSLTGGTYTVAHISGGDTTTWVDGKTTFSDKATLEQIMIEEVVLGTLTESELVKLKFTDSDFEWYEGDDFEIRGAGAFSGTYTDASEDAGFVDEDDIDAGEYWMDGNILYIMPDLPAADADDTGSIVLTGLGVDPDDADFGTVNVKVYGEDVTEETFEVGTYSDYDVLVYADEDDDMATIYSGKVDDDTDVAGGDDANYGNIIDDGADDSDYGNAYNGEESTEYTSADASSSDANELMTLVLEESVAKSWISDRTTTITFPDWVKIMDVVVEDDTDDVSATEVYEDINDGSAGDFAEFDNSVSFSVDKDADADTAEVWLTFYVSVEADHTGDIVATVGGSSLEEDYEVKLGEAVAPLSVDIETADVKIGLQDQEAGVITLTEAAAEVLKSGRYIVLSLEDEIEFASTPKVEVTEGDLTIDDVEKNGSTIEIKIDDESTEASTIQISGIEVNVDRTVEEGPFDIDVQGNAVVQNYNDDGDDFRFDTDSLVSTAFVNVITPADTNTKARETVAFTIDSMEYKIGDTVVTMDVAPYIDSANRTMLPLRAFANALGVADTDILWNGTERSVTIFKGEAVVKVVIGQMSFMKNGVAVPMDTMAVIKDGRTFLPVRALGQALGADIGWDAATRTVTID